MIPPLSPAKALAADARRNKTNLKPAEVERTNAYTTSGLGANNRQANKNQIRHNPGKWHDIFNQGGVASSQENLEISSQTLRCNVQLSLSKATQHQQPPALYRIQGCTPRQRSKNPRANRRILVANTLGMGS